MTRPFTLQPLLDLMQTRSDEATRRLGRLISAEQSARSRLALLEQYREEYAQRYREAVSGGLTPMALRNFQDFMARIDDAIRQQAQAVADSEQGTAAGQAAWKEQNKRLKASDTLSDRHEARERYRDNRQEQKEQDEYAARTREGQKPDDA